MGVSISIVIRVVGVLKSRMSIVRDVVAVTWRR